jgi:hypothetical protein
MGFIVLFASYRSTQFVCQSQTDSAAKSISAPFYSTVQVSHPSGGVPKLDWSRDQSFEIISRSFTKLSWNFGEVSEGCVVQVDRSRDQVNWKGGEELGHVTNED